MQTTKARNQERQDLPRRRQRPPHFGAMRQSLRARSADMSRTVATLGAAALLAGCVLAGALLTACGGDSGSAQAFTSPPTTTARVPPAEQVSLDQANYGAGTGVLLGGSLRVTLPAGTAPNPWVLAGSVAPELTLSSTTAASGEEVLTFDAVKTGTVTLRLRNTATGSSWWAVVAVFTLHFTPKNFVRPEPGIVRGTTVGP